MSRAMSVTRMLYSEMSREEMVELLEEGYEHHALAMECSQLIWDLREALVRRHGRCILDNLMNRRGRERS